ncbi:MAG TPA: tetratricopeptide repeat protein, partial [Ktedonobacterales bacterium]|nr:tetratricopeptide repeat protein [Ktedonobacterales bacterium]
APADTAAASKQIVRARAVVELGTFEFAAAHDADARRRATQTLETGLAHAREAGDARYAVWAMTTLSVLYRYQNDPARAGTLFEDALDIARRSGDDGMLLMVTGNFGRLFSLLVRGEDDRAAGLAEEAIALARKLGNQEAEMNVSRVVFLTALRRGDLDRVRQIVTEGIRLAQQSQLVSLLPPYVAGFAYLATAEGQHQRAARLMGAAMAHIARLASVPSEVEQATVFGPVQPSRDALGEQRWQELMAAGALLTLDEAIAEALDEPGAGAE